MVIFEPVINTSKSIGVIDIYEHDISVPTDFHDKHDFLHDCTVSYNYCVLIPIFNQMQKYTFFSTRQNNFVCTLTPKRRCRSVSSPTPLRLFYGCSPVVGRFKIVKQP